MKLEVCVENLASALAAEKAGASRLELCQNLALGGCTPSFGLLRSVLQNVNIPVCVLIRPRPGHFIFEADEWAAMADDVSLAANLGAAAVVIGGLTQEGRIDREPLWRLRQAFPSLDLVFHRAVDVCPEPLKAVEELAEMGFQRILSSGAKSAVRDGLPLLRQMHETAAGRLEILPGGGIRPKDKSRLLEESWIRSLHLSASLPLEELPGSLAPGMSGDARRVDEAWIRDWAQRGESL